MTEPHEPVEHDYGPSWCRVCRVKWPCPVVEAEPIPVPA